MMEKIIVVDAVGDTCPIPVVKTKKAIEQLNGVGHVEVFVDNEIAVQNLTKMAKQKGYGIRSEKLAEQKYRVLFTIGENAKTDESKEEETASCIADLRKDTVIAIASSVMGDGDSDLGKILIKGFIYALTQQEEFPATILFYNSGAFLTCEESEIISDLKQLEAQGVEILTCGTCLNHYQLADQLKVGGVTNMYAIAEKLMKAGHIIKP